DGQRLVDQLERRNADRAAGAVNHLDARREHLVDAVPDDGVGLAAADLHDLPRARRDLGDLARHRPGDLAVAKLGEVLHWLPAAGLAELAELAWLAELEPARLDSLQQLPS